VCQSADSTRDVPPRIGLKLEVSLQHGTVMNYDPHFVVARLVAISRKHLVKPIENFLVRAHLTILVDALDRSSKQRDRVGCVLRLKRGYGVVYGVEDSETGGGRYLNPFRRATPRHRWPRSLKFARVKLEIEWIEALRQSGGHHAVESVLKVPRIALVDRYAAQDEHRTSYVVAGLV